MGETINDPQNDLNDNEGLGVAPPRKSERKHRAATTMTCDRDLKPTTTKSHAKVAKGQMKQKKSQPTEEMIAPQQSHNINSLNGTWTAACMKHKC